MTLGQVCPVCGMYGYHNCLGPNPARVGTIDTDRIARLLEAMSDRVLQLEGRIDYLSDRLAAHIDGRELGSQMSKEDT